MMMKVHQFKRQAALYGQAIILAKQLWRGLEEFVRHKSSLYPPSTCTKSDLLNKCTPWKTQVRVALLLLRNSLH